MNKSYQEIVDKTVKGNGPVLKDVNPSTNETIAQLKTMTSQDLDEAVDRADEASSSWSAFSPFKRGLILLKAGELMEQQVEEYTELMTVEEGKPLKDSKLEVIRSYNTLKFQGEINATVPRGSRVVNMEVLSLADGIVLPPYFMATAP